MYIVQKRTSNSCKLQENRTNVWNTKAAVQVIQESIRHLVHDRHFAVITIRIVREEIIKILLRILIF